MEASASLITALFFGGLTVASLSATPPAAAQQGYGLKIYRVESGLYPFVHVYLRTFDEQLRPLTNLNERNVGLMVKGRAYDPAKGQYRIEPLRARPDSVRTVLVFDASGSMHGSTCERALRLATAFVDSKRPQDRVAVLALADTPQGFDLASEFEADSGVLGRRLSEVRCTGQTSRLYDTIGAAYQMAGMAWQGNNSGDLQYGASTSVVVISDGVDEGSALSREELNTRISTLAVPIPIYVLAVATKPSPHLKNLESLTKNSFGRFFPAETVSRHAQRAIDEIHNVQESDYVLTFRSHLDVDGEEHVFKIGVQYPAGVGGYTYQTAKFEAIQPPHIAAVTKHIEQLSRRMPKLAKGESPFLPAVEGVH